MVEIAIVLVILGLLMSGFVAGFSNYRDRAEYLGHGRASELDELIAMDKRAPKIIDPDAPVLPSEPEFDPEPDPDAEVVDRRPVWVRWLEWWRSSGRRRA